MKTYSCYFVAFISALICAMSVGSLFGENEIRIAVSITNPTTQTLKIVQYNPTKNLISDYVTVRNVEGITERNLRDLTFCQGELYCVMGTFSPRILRANPNRTQSFAYPGWSFINSTRFGAITSIGPSLYVADMWTANGHDTGLIRFLFDYKNKTSVVARFNDTASIADVTSTSDGRLVIVDEFGRILHINTNENEDDMRFRVFDPEPLSHLRGHDYHVTCALALVDGTMVYGTMQHHVLVERPGGATTTYEFNGIISDLDQIGVSESVVVCDTSSGTFSILDIKNNERFVVQFADPLDRASAFACTFTIDSDTEIIGPPTPKKPDSPQKSTPKSDTPRSRLKRSEGGVVTMK